MAQRIFHQRLTVGVQSFLALLTLLVIYLFWTKQALLGLLVVIVIVGMTERVLHTTYTFMRTKPVDRDDEMEFLVINRGRFSANKAIALRDITQCTTLPVSFGLSHHLLIHYGAGKMVAIQPDQEQAFITELNKRQKAEEASLTASS